MGLQSRGGSRDEAAKFWSILPSLVLPLAIIVQAAIKLVNKPSCHNIR
jgi:hypothetical protein